METVFVAGSRAVKELPEAVRRSLDRIRRLGFLVLVGDCYGVDTLVQEYLKAQDYQRVRVYPIGAKPRHCLEFPPVRIEGARQSDKDQAMAARADYGLASGTVRAPARKRTSSGWSAPGSFASSSGRKNKRAWRAGWRLKEARMLVVRVSRMSGKVHQMDLPVTPEQLEAWRRGELIQDVMPHLSAAEREFLISGVTPAEWEALFGDDDL
jgi:hypothetical protein